MINLNAKIVDTKFRARFRPSIPHTLLDEVAKHVGAINDAHLSILLDVAPPVISKIRHGNMSIGCSMLIKMHEITNVSINDLRRIGGIPKIVQTKPEIKRRSYGNNS